MTTIITRLYAAEEQAVGAVNALKRRFRGDEINLVTPTSSQDADIEALAVKGGVRASDAPAYAEKIQQGHSLVTVHAPWGFAKEAIGILDSHGPVDSGVAESEYHTVPTSHEASPFSDAMGWPVLIPFKSTVVLDKNDPAPFSKYFKWPTLFPSKSSAKLVDDPAPFSKILNLPTLSSAKPFSSLVPNDKSHVKLVHDAAPFSAFFHLPVLVDDKPKKP
jgi:hypothetical protein